MEVFQQAAELEKKAAAEKAAEDLNHAKGKVNQLLDVHPECENWAQAGECQANTAWMMSNCARSCVGHMLNMQSDEKIDHHAECAKWASSGECSKNVEWMTLNCKKSCEKGAAGNDLEGSHEEHEMTFGPTRGRKIVDEGHQVQ